LSIAALVNSGSCSTVADFLPATVTVATLVLVKPAMPLLILTLTAWALSFVIVATTKWGRIVP
jgi:hypothetical protein